MAEGPGIYDAECTAIREATGAKICLLAIMGGNKGAGFSVQSTHPVADILPGILRQIADEIEKVANAAKQ